MSLKRFGSDKIPSSGVITCTASSQIYQAKLHHLEKGIAGWACVLLGILVQVTGSITTTKGKAKLSYLDYPKMLESVTWKPAFGGDAPIWDTVRGVDYHYVWTGLLGGAFQAGQQPAAAILPDADTSDAAGGNVTDSRVQSYYLPISDMQYGPDYAVATGVPTCLLAEPDTIDFRMAATTCFDTDHSFDSFSLEFFPVLTLVPPSKLTPPIIRRLGAMTTAENAFTIGPFKTPPADVENAFICGDLKGMGGGNGPDNILTIRVGMEWPTTSPFHLYQDQIRNLVPGGLPFFDPAANTYNRTAGLLLQNCLALPVRLVAPTFPFGAHPKDGSRYDNGLLVTLTKTAGATERVIYQTRDRYSDVYDRNVRGQLAAAKL